MKKFILIDQSIKDGAGHHLEYALRVMRAAKDKGYQTVLGVHKDCEPIVDASIDVVDKVFHYTFWDNMLSETRNVTPVERKYIKNLMLIKDRVTYSVAWSSIGFVYMAAAQGMDFRQITERYGSVAAGKRISIIKIVTGYALFKANVLRQALQVRLMKHIPNRLFRYLKIASIGLIGIVVAPVAIPYFIIRRKALIGLPDQFAMVFSRDVLRLLVSVNAGDGDVVFIPTLGNVELVGASIAMEKLSVYEISWHFLFRRNIFTGREPGYQHQVKNLIKTIQAYGFCKSITNKVKSRVNFYTDTLALTDQYNRLGMFRFDTLPIPLDERLRHNDVGDSCPINITYIGDARDEKGFPLLPRLVADMRAAGFRESDVRYTLQSNFNVPGGEPASKIAKAELMSGQGRLVDLVEGPFDTQEYTEFINNSDIILIPYNAYNYYARSSGIFAETIAAGVPFVASDRSWMSQEMLRYNQEYYAELLKEYRIVKVIPFDKCQSHSRLIIRPDTDSDCVYLLVEVNLPAGYPGYYLQVSWMTSPYTVLRPQREQQFFRRYIVDMRNERAYALMRLPNAERIMLSFEVDTGCGDVIGISRGGIHDISINIYQMDLPVDTPLFKGGAFFVADEDFAIAVMEVVTKHKEYLDDVKGMQPTWNKFHSSDMLVERLGESVE